MYRFLFFLLGMIVFFSACQQSQNSNSSAEQAQTTPANPPAAATTAAYNSVPLDTLMMLWEKCDYIDFIFYNFNFSMSQNEQASIRTTLRHISDQFPTINPACKPLGRIFYQVDGKNAMEGEFYLGEGCVYFIFFENGKPAYANMMTKDGIDFFRNIFSQMMNSTQQGQ